MIKVDKIEVLGWEAAIRGMRNPMNSWDKSDSCEHFNRNGEVDGYEVGSNDLDLMNRLVNAGTDHSKFMRMILVTMDITAPLYWWKEFDTYKVGTTANSTSTMHKIHAKKFELDDFSHDRLDLRSLAYLKLTTEYLEIMRQQFIETKDKQYWDNIIQLLPSSYNQLRTVQLNYEVLRRIYHARKNHKLKEWRELCETIKQLPYANELIVVECDKSNSTQT